MRAFQAYSDPPTYFMDSMAVQFPVIISRQYFLLAQTDSRIHSIFAFIPPLYLYDLPIWYFGRRIR